MTRVLVAFSFSAAPASAGKSKYRPVQGEKQTYMNLAMETVSITNYQLGVLDAGSDGMPYLF
jgi:hypothetical protein